MIKIYIFSEQSYPGCVPGASSPCAKHNWAIQVSLGSSHRLIPHWSQPVLLCYSLPSSQIVSVIGSSNKSEIHHVLKSAFNTMLYQASGIIPRQSVDSEVKILSCQWDKTFILSYKNLKIVIHVFPEPCLRACLSWRWKHCPTAPPDYWERPKGARCLVHKPVLWKTIQSLIHVAKYVFPRFGWVPAWSPLSTTLDFSSELSRAEQFQSGVCNMPTNKVVADDDPELLELLKGGGLKKETIKDRERFLAQFKWCRRLEVWL